MIKTAVKKLVEAVKEGNSQVTVNDRLFVCTNANHYAVFICLSSNYSGSRHCYCNFGNIIYL